MCVCVRVCVYICIFSRGKTARGNLGAWVCAGAIRGRGVGGVVVAALGPSSCVRGTGGARGGGGNGRYVFITRATRR